MDRHGFPVLFWLVLTLVLFAGYYLVTEHWPHLVRGLGLLPYLLILACPLMHLFHHGRHHHHHDRSDRSTP